MDALREVAFPLILLAFMLVGLLGVILPILPGLVMIWAAALVYGLVMGFEGSGIALFALLTVLMLIGSVVDNVLMGGSARRSGASWVAVGVALLGALVGSLLWPPLGGLLLALIGIFAVEYLRLRDWRKALDSTRGLAVGCGWAVVVRALIALLMIGLWLVWWLAR
ncbi:DUF456 domain-containing protein [Thermanaerothrix sp. 4228-RoL]|uniref:DUF456 domain-containing protein n=1 Tax=Thermanaerothrix solaris TaxID=3058434 RepID=A0ABU3NMT7_9CHLR|nr:DUF456 domain-containing protein [Thermanaerothrix sp. 4228-RoL]MDT8898159.1 DUF456 domain-containing protein [Thermanaerothrix sp. 4228-RoL]